MIIVPRVSTTKLHRGIASLSSHDPENNSNRKSSLPTLHSNGIGGGEGGIQIAVLMFCANDFEVVYANLPSKNKKQRYIGML